MNRTYANHYKIKKNADLWPYYLELFYSELPVLLRFYLFHKMIKLSKRQHLQCLQMLLQPSQTSMNELSKPNKQLKLKTTCGTTVFSLLMPLFNGFERN